MYYIIPHSVYCPFSGFNDIALLKLSQPVDLNIYTPACLPEKGDDFTGEVFNSPYSGVLTVFLLFSSLVTSMVGECLQNLEYYITDFLLEATQELVSNADCIEAFAHAIIDSITAIVLHMVNL